MSPKYLFRPLALMLVVQANDILITESFDQATTERLEQELLPIAPAK